MKNIKSAKRGNRSAHLKNSIDYILNPAKTEDGLWIGSNCGTNKTEIYDAMMQTKQEYGKEWGRQGYHFVVSFPPGECDEETAYKVGKEFCEELLKEYDYCFSVHNDHAHMHIHVVFNSVNRISGYKYRYVDGDWERLIQPVTDRLCEKYGLSKLEYEKDTERVGKSYTEHMAQKDKKPTWVTIIRQDIDYAESQAKDISEYYRILEGMGYSLQEGYSRKRQASYVSYHAPGMERARRDYRLGEDYTISAIRKRIIDKAYDEDVKRISDAARKARSGSTIFPDYNLDIARLGSSYILQINMIFRVNQATGYLGLKLGQQEQIRVRRDLIQIDRYREEANYLLDNNIRTPEEVQERLTAVRKQLRAAKKTMPENDIRFLLLKKERQILMHIEKDTDETMHVRPLTKNMTLDTFGHHVQKYRIPGKQIAAGEVREDESLWKN